MTSGTTPRSHRAHNGRTALAVAVAVALVATACTEPAPLAVQRAVARAGQPATRAIVGGVSRPTTVGEGETLRLALPAIGATTLELAFAPRDGAALPTHCRAALSGPGLADVVVDLPAAQADAWVEVASDLPPAPAGATLTLRCEGGSALWARPVLLPRAEKGDEGQAPLVVVMSLDTLRADHVTGFARGAPATPALAALAAEGVPFHAAVSPFTWTLPAHFALLHSRLPGFPAAPRPPVGLARLLSDAGYATAAFTGGGFVGAALGFDEGFDRYADRYARKEAGHEGGHDGARSERSDIEILPDVLAEASRWVDAHAGAPSFLFLHTYAVHEVPPSERQKLGAGALVSPYRLSPSEVDVARAHYVGLVERLDATLAPFFERMRVVAERRPTLLVVVSDHGEAFGEHGNLRHGISGPSVTLHDEVVRVPVIFWGPGVAAASEPVRSPFSLLDVSPTLLAATGIAVPPEMVGRDFWPLLRGPWIPPSAALRSRWAEPQLSYKDPGWGSPASWALRTDASKTIVQRRSVEGVPTLETYDLVADPAESRNLSKTANSAAVAEASDAVRAALDRARVEHGDSSAPLPVCPACGIEGMESWWHALLERSRPPSSSVGVDPSVRERLRALGYVQ